jgi:hypothetical protein
VTYEGGGSLIRDSEAVKKVHGIKVFLIKHPRPQVAGPTIQLFFQDAFPRCLIKNNILFFFKIKLNYFRGLCGLSGFQSFLGFQDMLFIILRKTPTTKIETNIPARTTPNAKTGFFNVSKIFHHIKIQSLAALQELYSSAGGGQGFFGKTIKI